MTLDQGTFSYSGDPSYSVGDEVRFLMQDTDRTDPQVSDEEIAYMVTQHGNASTSSVARPMRQASPTPGGWSGRTRWFAPTSAMRRSAVPTSTSSARRGSNRPTGRRLPTGRSPTS